MNMVVEAYICVELSAANLISRMIGADSSGSGCSRSSMLHMMLMMSAIWKSDSELAVEIGRQTSWMTYLYVEFIPESYIVRDTIEACTPNLNLIEIQHLAETYLAMS